MPQYAWSRLRHGYGGYTQEEEMHNPNPHCSACKDMHDGVFGSWASPCTAHNEDGSLKTPVPTNATKAFGTWERYEMGGRYEDRTLQVIGNKAVTICNSETGETIAFLAADQDNVEHLEVRAAVFAEAGSIAAETGMTPGQLQAYVVELRAALGGLLLRVADDEEYGPDHAITKARSALARIEP